MRIDEARSLKPAVARLKIESSFTVYARPWKFGPSYSTTRVRPPPHPPPGLPPGLPPPGIGRSELTCPLTPPRLDHRPGPSTSHELRKSASAQSCHVPEWTMADC